MTPQKKKLRCRGASESLFPGILDEIFWGFIDFKIVYFRCKSVEGLAYLRSGSQMFDKYMCHVCHDVCDVCGEDLQVGSL